MAVKIEDLDIKGLAKHTPDEVLAEVLDVAEVKYSFRDFYHRWEHQQWQATEVDLTKDAAQWAGLPAPVSTTLTEVMSQFYNGEESVTRNLGPLLIAAPRVEHEIFLSTQIVDEARHLVFFERYFNEVVGMDGDAETHIASFKPKYSRWYSTLFFDERLGLDGRADGLRQNPGDIGLYAETVALYHLILEAGLALLGQRFLLDMCRGLDVLPGFYIGFMAVTRDESRHVNYGVYALRKAFEAGLHDHIVESAREYMDGPCDLLTRPIDKIVLPPDEMMALVPEELRQGNFFEEWDFPLVQLRKRLGGAGIRSESIDELDQFWWNRVAANVEGYEERFGEPHPAIERDPDGYTRLRERVAVHS